MTISKKYWRLFVFGFGVFVFLTLTYLAFNLTSFCYEWCIGDWLINYQGGIVRRGLTGEIFFKLSQIIGINQITLTVLFQIITYGIYTLNSCKLASNSYFSIPNIALLLSPAFILFPILDPLGAFRKEILLYVLLSSICVYLSPPINVHKFFAPLISIISIFIVLSHEMLIIYLPYIVFAVSIYEGGFGSRTKKAATAIIPAILIGLLLAIFAKGDEQITSGICKSIKEYAPLDCISSSALGSISFLSKDLSFAHNFVLESMGSGSVIVYVLLATLGFMPLSLIIRTGLNNSKMRWAIARFYVVPVIASVPLFWIVADFGRIIYINVSCLSLLVLFANPDKDDRPLTINLKNGLSLICCLLFVSSWRLVHFNVSLEKAFPIAKYLMDLFGNF